ncbi:hypothetical protein H5410_032508, partial [Solanum commersonii]
ASSEHVVTSLKNVVKVSVDIEDVSPNIAADHTADVGVKKSARGSRPPIWHKDYVVKAGSSTCLYPLIANIDYSGLSSKYQSYVSKDKLVECYFWILGVYFEPKYSRARKMLTKVIQIDSVINDTFDAYVNELVPFTDAIQRSDTNPLDEEAAGENLYEGCPMVGCWLYSEL